MKKLMIPLLLLLIAVFPLIPIANNFLLQIGIVIFIHILFGQAWNILGGYTGFVSFGHAMFFGIGAYATMILIVDHKFNPFVSLFIGALLAFLFAIVVGLLLFKLHGPYFALGTLALAEIVRLIANNWKSLTHGGQGILLVEMPKTLLGSFDITLGSKLSFFYLSFFLAVIATAFVYKLSTSRMGYFLVSIRENEEASLALGINTVQYKILSLATSAFIAGIAGGLMAMVVGIIEPGHTFSVHFSAEMIFVTVIGGIGTVFGPVVGALTLVIVSELLKEHIGTSYLMVYGFVLMLVILYMPEGIYGFIKKKINRKKTAAQKSAKWSGGVSDVKSGSTH